jgi:tetratricopeptide (TPR) repeat protein
MLLKKFKASMSVLTMLAMLFISFVALAQTETDYFAQGVKDSSSGKHEAALKQFQMARKAGMKSAKLDYNLAVTYYRLGRYEESRKIFMKLTNNDVFSQLTYFNLGLIANKQKNERKAVKWFQRAYKGKSEKVGELAAIALKRLGKMPKKTVRKKPAWKGLVSASLESDSNVNLATDEVNEPSKSDTSMSLYASANRWLKGNRKDGVRLDLNVNSQTYSSETQYNYLQLHARLSRYGRLGSWRTRFSGSWDEITLDNSAYERIISARADGRYNLSKDRQLRLRYRLSRILADSTYDYLDGWRHQLRAGVRQRYGKKRVRAYYQLEVNDRDDYISPISGRFASYSPTRHVLRVTGYLPVSDSWTVRLDGRLRMSRYADANEFSVGAPKKREDDQYRLGVKLTHKFDKRLEFAVEYQHTDNNSNIDVYDYDRSLVRANVSWFY